MKFNTKLVLLKIRIAIQSVAWLMSKPNYLLLAAALSLVFFEFVYWMFNLSTFWALMSSTKLGLSDKLDVLMSPFSSLQAQNGELTFAMMILLSIIQGIALASLTYVVRNQPKVDAKLLGGSATVGFLAVVGLGCPACGTSLVTPLVTLFVSGSAASVSETITQIALPVAVLVGGYGLYAVGKQVANTRAVQPVPAQPTSHA